MDIDQVSLCSEAQAELLCYYPTPPPDAALREYLHEVFHLKEFRASQLEAIKVVLSGRDCFVSMATGSGKSLVWQLPALVQTGFTKLTVVICPTKSLIMDQMSKLCRMARTCSFQPICYHRDQPPDLNEIAARWLGRLDVLPHCLLVTPELLTDGHGPNNIKTKLKDIHAAGRLARFVIDEADKYLGWGQSFRDAYLGLSNLRKEFPDTPILAMTGSITKASMDASIQKLGMRRCLKIYDSLNRPNIYYEVKQKKSRSAFISDIEQLTSSGSGIIYCTHRKETEHIAAKLRHISIEAWPFHTGLSKERRKNVLDTWRRGEITVVVATTAFGMGIDKENVRWVVHDTMPSSIEGWFQESGRAGRDGLPARSIVYFQIEDCWKVKQLIANTISSEAALASCLKPLHEVTEVLLDNVSCRRQRLLRHFGEDYTQENCGTCDYCAYKRNDSYSLQDVTIDAQNALNLLAQMREIANHPHWTEKCLAAAIYGERIKKFRVLGVTALKGFGCHFALAHGRDATRSQILEFLVGLIHKEVLVEYKLDRSNGQGSSHSQYYIKPGPRENDVLDMTYRIHIPIKNPNIAMDIDRDEKMGPEFEMIQDEAELVQEKFEVVREVDTRSGKMVDVIVLD